MNKEPTCNHNSSLKGVVQIVSKITTSRLNTNLVDKDTEHSGRRQQEHETDDHPPRSRCLEGASPSRPNDPRGAFQTHQLGGERPTAHNNMTPA